MDDKIKNMKLPWALEEELRKARARPSWESTNVGVHERVNFDDTIWGFQLAGGIYYNTPLRITYVKEDSRAEHAGIKPGDVLRSINDIDTSTISLEDAHAMILESGLQIRLAVSAPDVEETTYFVYQDEIVEQLREAKRQASIKAKKQHKKFNGAKTNDAWSLAWPCSKKRDVTYRESNCFLVPSRFQEKHPAKLEPQGHDEKIEKIVSSESEKMSPEQTI
ncbi:uncharacterized protein LOC105390645 isoform X1 [Plutella xylostella]|uniref:uncharacterized protein LOC105390645 isoform X1 n=2 Tax=Plutella xylostella TaxID=51655 RepID=UPI0020328115|nr:uncharacterized protein LOC105390645 isoform X1 [Plutella xylostella]